MGITGYAVLLIYLLVLLGIGWRFRSAGKDETSFFLAGRSMEGSRISRKRSSNDRRIEVADREEAAGTADFPGNMK